MEFGQLSRLFIPDKEIHLVSVGPERPHDNPTGDWMRPKDRVRIPV